MINVIQIIMTGVAMGLIYSIVAIGFVLIYKSSKIFNFAQGEMVMIGCYLVWFLISIIHLPFIMALFFAFFIAAVAGYFFERFPLRPMIGQPILSIIMITLAFSVFLHGMAILFFAKYIGVKFPDVIPYKTFHVFHIPISMIHIAIFLSVAILVIGLSIFFHYTRTGLHMRATAESHQLSQSMGIRVTKSIAFSWAIAAGVSTIGGFLLGYVSAIDFAIAGLGLNAIAAALVGGLESFKGAIIGGIIIGLAESFTGFYVGHGLRDVMPYIVMVLVLICRPYGIFGLKEIERV